MDVITFEFDNITIQLVGDMALLWKDGTNHIPDIEISIDHLQCVLSVVNMLRGRGNK